MRLEGSLDAFSLPDIFSLLSMTKKTGGLHLRRADAHGVVWLGDGLITGGASNLSRLSLGRRLAGSGHVADNHLSAALEEVAKGTDLGIARALRDSRAIDEGELHTEVCEHIVDTVFDLMRWPDGVFEFVVDEGNLDDIGVAREVDEVVTEARRRIDIWSAIDDRVAAPDTVLSLTLELATDPQVQRDEWQLLAMIDGRRTVEDLVNVFGRGEYSVVVALAELVGRGLVRTDDSAGITSLLRRQDLIASLETGATATPAPTRTPLAAAPPIVDSEPAAVSAAPEVSQPANNVDQPEPPVMTPVTAVSDPDDGDDDHTRQVAEIATLPRSASLTTEIAAVIPQRPEPFKPSREPDHPEPLAAAAAGGGMVAAPAAMPAGAIERDPSVNKSLLLRLIAGVRGL